MGEMPCYTDTMSAAENQPLPDTAPTGMTGGLFGGEPAPVIDLDEARARRQASQSWSSAPTTPAAPPRAPVAPSPTPLTERLPSGATRTVYPATSRSGTNEWPHPQEGPEMGTMQLWDGFEPIILPGRCMLCGFHVPTQLHRRYCPNTGKSGAESQHEMFGDTC